MSAVLPPARRDPHELLFQSGISLAIMAVVSVELGWLAADLARASEGTDSGLVVWGELGIGRIRGTAKARSPSNHARSARLAAARAAEVVRETLADHRGRPEGVRSGVVGGGGAASGSPAHAGGRGADSVESRVRPDVAGRESAASLAYSVGGLTAISTTIARIKAVRFARRCTNLVR
ncbi:hypothetical protein [Nonomuraea sp. NPDC049625]|uniref:hypothetical protein n=1 Tax=Nonomuraea sp. NPDC049625 TaxID=3155775 RepID=UPI00343D743A